MKIKKLLGYMCFIVIFIWLIITFFKVGKTYSKYLESFKVQSVSGIAKPCFSLEKQNVFEKENLNLDVISYEFSVKNFDSDKVSETAFKYNIGFEFSQKEAPLIIKLYRICENEEMEVELLENSTVNPEKFGINEEQASYKVIVYYDLDSNKIMNKNLKINVKVEAIQEEEEINN